MYFTLKSRQQVYEEAIVKYGVEHQYNVAIEEFSELIKELCKLMRVGYIYSRDPLIDEIADVKVMIEQLEHIFVCSDEVATRMYEKVQRLKFRLGES